MFAATFFFQSIWAQAVPPELGWPTWLVNGSVGAVAIYFMWRLINSHAETVKAMTAEFRNAIADKDQQLLDQAKTSREQASEFRVSVEKLWDKIEKVLDEMRTEFRSNALAQQQMGRDVLLALEHVRQLVEENREPSK
jgi:hypothetical protein